MPTLPASPVSIRRQRGGGVPAGRGVIVGTADVAAWLAVAARGEGPVHFWLLPQRQGALVTFSKALEQGALSGLPNLVACVESPSAQKSPLYLPAGWEVFPQLTEVEWRRSFPHEMTLHHPALGWIAWEASEALQAPQLLALAGEGTAGPARHWLAASRGEEPERAPFRGVRLRMDDVPMEEMMSADALGSGDIGSGSLKSLAGGTMSNLGGALFRWSAGGVASLLGGLSRMFGWLAFAGTEPTANDRPQGRLPSCLMGVLALLLIAWLLVVVGTGLRMLASPDASYSPAIGLVLIFFFAAAAFLLRQKPRRPPPLPVSHRSPVGRVSQQPGGAGLAGRLRALQHKLTEAIEQRRHRELNRLLELLKTNPALGMKYALPLSGGGNLGRGVAPPGGELTMRSTTYGRGSAGPTDYWNIPSDLQARLSTQYRNLANEAMARGETDRAAYIFAQLLGDWTLAANALSKGGRAQEAARIWLEKLNNKRQAAACLEEAGLLDAALPIYAELGMHEKRGDLLKRLGRMPEATQAFQQAVTSASDRIEAARILFEKMGLHGLALSTLRSGWPDSSQAILCLEAQFAYIKRLSRPDLAAALAGELEVLEKPWPAPKLFLKALADIADREPHRAVQLRLRAHGITTAARALANLRDTGITDVLPRFAPEDKLLLADARRFISTTRRPRPEPDFLQGSTLSPSWQVFLPPDEVPHAIIQVHGQDDADFLVLARSRGAGWALFLCRSLKWARVAVELEDCPPDVPEIRLALTQNRLGQGWIIAPGHPSLCWRLELNAVTSIADLAPASQASRLKLARASFVPPHTIAISCLTSSHAIHCLTMDPSGVYSLQACRTVDAASQPVSSAPQLSKDLEFAHGGNHAALCSTAQPIFISLDEYVWTMDAFSSGARPTIIVAGPVRRLSTTTFADQSGQATGLLIEQENEITLGLRRRNKWGECVQLFVGTGRVCGCFLRNGMIAVTDGERGVIYTPAPEVKERSTFSIKPGSTAADITPLGRQGFAVLGLDGTIAIFGQPQPSPASSGTKISSQWRGL